VIEVVVILIGVDSDLIAGVEVFDASVSSGSPVVLCGIRGRDGHDTFVVGLNYQIMVGYPPKDARKRSYRRLIILRGVSSAARKRTGRPALAAGVLATRILSAGILTGVLPRETDNLAESATRDQETGK
jgi:hypothetical protein